MIRAVYSNAVVKDSSWLYVALLLLASQLVWTGTAQAVCEELFSQVFSRTLDLRKASKSCRMFIEKNVQAHAFAATLIEVCKKRKNYSSRYKSRIYRVAHRCVEKQSANWLVRKYKGAQTERLKLLKANVEITGNAFCEKKNVVSYLRMAEKALSKTLSDARSNCN